jgi:hypothetical protein
MAGYTCPFCDHAMAINQYTLSEYNPNFSNSDSQNVRKESLNLKFYKCPNCLKISIYAQGIGDDIKNIFIPIYPNSLAKQFPEYIPQAIRGDYEEACAIVNLSPKASATLSRRCLQGMIRDFWGIKKSRLVDEIETLKDKIHPIQWKVIDGVRRIGNIGAHMESDINLIVDIDPDEANKLIRLIENLIESWYVKRYEDELLYADIIGIDQATQIARKPKE